MGEDIGIAAGKKIGFTLKGIGQRPHVEPLGLKKVMVDEVFRGTFSNEIRKIKRLFLPGPQLILGKEEARIGREDHAGIGLLWRDNEHLRPQGLKGIFQGLPLGHGLLAVYPFPKTPGVPRVRVLTVSNSEAAGVSHDNGMPHKITLTLYGRVLPS